MKHFVDPNDRPIKPPDEPLNSMPFLDIEDLPEDSFDNSSTSQNQADTVNQNELTLETRFDTARETTDIESAALIDNETVFNAEKLLDTRISNGTVQYLVKWAGFPRAQATWGPSENILDNRLLQDFQKSQSQKQ